jgi:hypothetical protein
MSKIFISYRRKDSQNATGRILDRLKQVFKTDEIFMDVESIPKGTNFLEFSKNRLQGAEIVVAIIGKNWANSLKERENDPNDFVRIEIEQALALKLPILPIYVDGAEIPGPLDLPQSIREFTYFNGTHVRPNPDFENDMVKVIETIKQNVSKEAIKPKEKSSATWIDRFKYIAIGVIAIVGVLLYLTYNRDCDKMKTGVLIANFQDIEHDGFSNSILTNLQKTLSDTIYDIHNVGYQPRNRENYDSYIKKEYFESSCTPDGLFVNGFLSTEQNVFNLYTSLINIKVQLPDFVTELLLSYIRIIEGNASDALKRINELEKNKDIQDKDVMATLSFMKGHCYALNGDEKRAAASYKKAQTSDNIQLTKAAESNIEQSHKISLVYQSNPKTAEIRMLNVEQHSQFEKELEKVEKELNKVLNTIEKIEKIQSKVPVNKIFKKLNLK